jgi:cephalosporin hydroxylase
MKVFSKKVNGYEDSVNVSIKSIEVGHHKILYKGVPMIKCPFDYVIMQMIIFEVKPDLIIEIGTNRGGSTLYFADLLDAIGNGVIHTIDIDDIVVEEVKQHKRIKFFKDGFEGYDLTNAGNFKNILIVEDASHMYMDVKKTLNKFKDLISSNSYFVVEDGILDELGWKNKYNGGPNKAIKEFISENESFVIDRKWCDMFGINATFNTNGYLKKIK